LRDKERFRELTKKPYCEEKLKPPLDELCKMRVGSYRLSYILNPVR
jgi:mRNA-degrading endonuclease RelE of RelBE toxin-antitoxin system